jgi:hypothetical protein
MSEFDVEVVWDEPDIQVDPQHHFQPIIDQHALQMKNAIRKFNTRTAMLKEFDAQEPVIQIEIPSYGKYITSGLGKNPKFHSEITGLQKSFRNKVTSAMRSSIVDDITSATAEQEKVRTNFNTAIKTLWDDKCSTQVEDSTKDEHFSSALQALDAKAQQILVAQKTKRLRDPSGSPDGNKPKRSNGNNSPAGNTNSGRGNNGIAYNSQAVTSQSSNNNSTITNSSNDDNGNGNDSADGVNNQQLNSVIANAVEAFFANAKNGNTGSRPNNSSGNHANNRLPNGQNRNSGCGIGNNLRGNGNNHRDYPPNRNNNSGQGSGSNFQTTFQNNRYNSGKDGKGGQGNQRR